VVAVAEALIEKRARSRVSASPHEELVETLSARSTVAIR
jgi:hypothetical protein